MAKNESDKTKIAVMSEQILTIKNTTDEIKKKLDADYVTNDKLVLYTDRMERVEKIVYGLVVIVLTAFVLAIVKLVVLQ